MQVRITLAEIEAAWPNGIHARFASKGVRLETTDAPFNPSGIRFQEPCRWWWSEDGGLIVEQSWHRPAHSIRIVFVGFGKSRGSSATPPRRRDQWPEGPVQIRPSTSRMTRMSTRTPIPPAG